MTTTRSGLIVLLTAGLGLAAPAAEPPATPPAGAGQFPRSPEESEAMVRVADGFRSELFAAEPHLASPVAMTFDADGDVYVAEMLDYPIIRTPGMFGPFPEGQIRLLRTDDLGRVVRSSVFATAIAAPTSVLPCDGGVLVAAAPDILFLKDTDGDGHADVRRVVLTGFDASQDLYRLNSLLWGIDGWVYARGVGDSPIRWGDRPEGPPLSTEGMDFRFRPRTRQFEALSGMSSCFGLTMDDRGHRFFSNSANHVYQVVLPIRYLRRNPHLSAPPLTREISDHGGVSQVFRISEPQSWRVERSKMWEDSGLTRKYFGAIEPRQDYMTATCGPKIYRESAFPEAYRGNYFVCEAVGNLVHRDVLALKGDGPVYTASRGDEGREFFASADPWCSPVALEAGPDGALYIVDMYRQIIEHAGPDGGRDVPNVPLEILNKYGLRAGSTMGRIHRVFPEGMPPRPRPRLSRASPGELVDALGRPDAWWRTTAQRLILENPGAADVPAIVRIARRSPHAAARVQALWTLQAIERLDDDTILAALDDPDPGVREGALVLAEPRLSAHPGIARTIETRGPDQDPLVRLQLAFTLGELPAPLRTVRLANLARLNRAEDPLIRAAILSSVQDDALLLFRTLGEDLDVVDPKGSDIDRDADTLRGDVARLIGSRLDLPEIGECLARIAEGGRPRDAPALASLAEGIAQRGRTDLDLPADGQEALRRLLSGPSEGLRKAAEAVASRVRLQTDAERRAALGKALATAGDESRPVEERVVAARSLGAGAVEAVSTTLATLLHPRQPEPLQWAALQALADLRGPGVVKILEDAWPGLTPSLRPKAIAVALGRKDRLVPLLEAVGRGEIPREALDARDRAGLLASTDRAVAEAARAVFGAPDRAIDPRKFEAVRGALAIRGDAGRGLATFRARCLTCHKARGEGSEVGPDLASVRDHPREQTLKDILYPSLVVAPQHVQYVVETDAGQVFTGLIVSSGPSSLTIRRPGLPDLTLLRRDIGSVSNSQVSLMPENLLGGLKHQEIADLLEFVKTVGR